MLLTATPHCLTQPSRSPASGPKKASTAHWARPEADSPLTVADHLNAGRVAEASFPHKEKAS